MRWRSGAEAYTPTDNVSELTARLNDDGGDTSFANCLRENRLRAGDMVFVLSAGGGNAEPNISCNLVRRIAKPELSYPAGAASPTT